MTAPNMATITASLERSLQNCSLSSSSAPSTESPPPATRPSDDASSSSLELNSHLSLPYDWEQCLDLKTGEVYYINWRTGLKVKEDPRKTEPFAGEYYSDDEDDDDDDEAEGEEVEEEEEEEEEESTEGESEGSSSTSPCSRSHYEKDHVLVVAGCKTCLMYFMLPKTVSKCPKCNGTILHFDREDNGYL